MPEQHHSNGEGGHSNYPRDTSNISLPCLALILASRYHANANRAYWWTNHWCGELHRHFFLLRLWSTIQRMQPYDQSNATNPDIVLEWFTLITYSPLESRAIEPPQGHKALDSEFCSFFFPNSFCEVCTSAAFPCIHRPSNIEHWNSIHCTREFTDGDWLPCHPVRHAQRSPQCSFSFLSVSKSLVHPQTK
jgi:hypothetical protein